MADIIRIPYILIRSHPHTGLYEWTLLNRVRKNGMPVGDEPVMSGDMQWTLPGAVRAGVRALHDATGLAWAAGPIRMVRSDVWVVSTHKTAA